VHIVKKSETILNMPEFTFFRKKITRGLWRIIYLHMKLRWIQACKCFKMRQTIHLMNVNTYFLWWITV